MFFPVLSDNTRRYLEVLSCISNRINNYLVAKIWEIDACVIYPIPSSSEFHPNRSPVNSMQCRRTQSYSWHPLPWHHHHNQKLLQFLLLFCFELLFISKNPFDHQVFSQKETAAGPVDGTSFPLLLLLLLLLELEVAVVKVPFRRPWNVLNQDVQDKKNLLHQRLHNRAINTWLSCSLLTR